MVCELQKVNVLPFERYGNYQRSFNKIRRMLETVNDHSLCDEKHCSWVKYHEGKSDILNGKFGTLKVPSNEGEPADRILQSFFTRAPASEIPLSERAENDLKNFIVDLLDELKDVFRSIDIEMIEKTRIITDWTTLALKIRNRSFPIVHALEKEQFAKNCKDICRSIRDVEDDDIKSQFHTFLKRLEAAVSDRKIEDLELTDPKLLIKLFSSSSSLFDGIEIIMRATYEACIKISVESVAESVISV